MLYEHIKPVYGFINEKTITGIRKRSDNSCVLRDDCGNEFIITESTYNELLGKGVKVY